MPESLPRATRRSRTPLTSSAGSKDLTYTVKQVFERVFNNLNGDGNKGAEWSLEVWAMKNPTEFYKLCARLIPTQARLEHSGDVSHTIVSGVPQPGEDMT